MNSSAPPPPPALFLCRPVLLALLIAAILLPHSVLFWPSLAGRTLILPMDNLSSPSVYLPAEPGHPQVLSRNWGLSDLVLYNAPVRDYAVREVRAGRLPLWNPYNYCGAPFLANQSEVFSPFQAPCYLFPDPRAGAWIQLLKALVAGLGAWWFFRREMGVGWAAAAIGAVCWPLSGPFFAWLGWPLSATCACLPWLLAGVGSCLRRPRAPAVVGLALITALLCLSGDPGQAAMIVCAAAIYGAFLLAVHAREWQGSRPGWRARLFAAAAGGLLGLALSAPLNLPMIEYMGFSARVAERLTGSPEVPPIGWAAFGQIAFPYLLGSSRACGFFAAETNLYESAAAGAAGAILLFALAPLAWSERRGRAWACFWTVLGLLGMGYIANLPGLAVLFSHPPLNALRGNRMTFLAAWSVLALAVAGADRLWRGTRPPVWLNVTAISAAVATAAWMGYRAFHLPGLYLQLLPEEAWAWFRNMYLAGAVWSAVAVASLLAVRFIRSRAVLLAIGLAAALELSLTMYGAWPQAPANWPLPGIPALEALKRLPPGRICGVGCLPPNLNLALGLHDIRGYDAVDNIRLVTLLRAANPSWRTKTPYAITQWYAPRAAPILHMLNLRYLVFRGTPPATPPSGTRIVAISEDYWVAENLKALPRAIIPRRVQVASEPEMLAQMARPAFDAREQAFSVESLGVTGPVTGLVQIVSETPGDVTLAYSNDAPALLVLADMWYPGWKADCIPVAAGGSVPRLATTLPVHRVNYALMGVVVPEGRGTIVMRYRPFSFFAGLILAAVAGVMLLMWPVLAAHWFASDRPPEELLKT